jgi:hypothetical protein
MQVTESAGNNAITASNEQVESHRITDQGPDGLRCFQNAVFRSALSISALTERDGRDQGNVSRAATLVRGGIVRLVPDGREKRPEVLPRGARALWRNRLEQCAVWFQVEQRCSI